MGQRSLPLKVQSGRALLFFIIIIVVVASGAAAVKAQTVTIRGRVADAVTREPLPGAVVEVQSSRQISRCNDRGTYELKGIPSGSYTLVFTSLGHFPDTIVVQVKTSDEVLTFDALLQPDAGDATSVVVTARRARESEASARQTEQSSQCGGDWTFT